MLKRARSPKEQVLIVMYLTHKTEIGTSFKTYLVLCRDRAISVLVGCSGTERRDDKLKIELFHMSGS